MENEPPVFRQTPAPDLPELDSSEGPQPAGFSERFLAYVIDAVPFLLGNYVTYAALSSGGARPKYATIVTVWVLLYILYQTVLSSGGRATLGKYALNLRVVAKDGSPLSLPKAFARALSYFISSGTFNAGFLLALATPENRTLHDYLAGSKVVSVKERGDLADGIVIALSWGLMAALGGAWINANVIKLSPEEKRQVVAAHKTITKLGVLQEFYYRRTGHYTNQIKPLAMMTGNVAAVRRELLANIEPDSLIIISNGREFTIHAKAKNWRNTLVEVRSKPRRANAPPPAAEESRQEEP